MSIPILKLYDHLVVPMQNDLDDRTVMAFQESLLNKIRDTGAKGVVIDVTAVETIDSFIAKGLADIVQTAELIGASVVVTGIQPAVAITLLELGTTMTGIETALNLEQGLEILRQKLEG